MTELLNQVDPLPIALVCALFGGLIRWGLALVPPELEDRWGNIYKYRNGLLTAVISSLAAGGIGWVASWASQMNGGVALLSIGLGFFGLRAALSSLNIDASREQKNTLDDILKQLNETE